MSSVFNLLPNRLVQRDLPSFSSRGKEVKGRDVQRIEIGRLPIALREEINKLQEEERASQLPLGRVKFYACIAAALIGGIVAIIVVFSQKFLPWTYALCIGALGAGGLGAKKIHTSNIERNEQIKELEDCSKDLTTGWRPAFRMHLGQAKSNKFSIPELLNIYRSYKASHKALEGSAQT